MLVFEMTEVLSFSLSVVIMPSGLQLKGNVLVTGDAFMSCGNMHFIVLILTC